MLLYNCWKAENKVAQLFLTLFDPMNHITHHAPLSMGFLRQEYWSGLPFPSPGDLPDPAIEPRSPALQAEALPSEPPGKPYNCWVDVKSIEECTAVSLRERLWTNFS